MKDTIKGFKVNGLHCSNFDIIMNDYNLPLIGKVDNNIINIPLVAGVKNYGTDVNEKIISIDCTMISENKERLKTNIRYLLGVITPFKDIVKLEFDDVPGVYYNVKLNSDIQVTKIHDAIEFTLDFISFEGTAIGEEKNAVFQSYTSIPNDGDLNIGFNATIIIRNASNYFQIKNETTGQYMRLEADFEENDLIEIDHEARFKVRRNGIPIPITLKSDFFKIVKGVNIITVEPANLEVNIKYRKRWFF